jgi:phosphonate transport system substrate-binding protein
MSSLVPQATLAAAGIALTDLDRYAHFPGHRNVALAVLSGQMDAGAVKSEVLQSFNGRGLRALAKLPEVSEHLFVARSDLPAETVTRIRHLLLDLAHSPRGLSILRQIHPEASGLVAVDDHDYDNLRDLLQALKQPDEHQQQSR